MTRTVSIEDRGFTLGDGVFDTALALGGVMFARERHVSRLEAMAGAIGIGEPASLRSGIEAAIDTVMGPEPAIVRTTVTRGITARGLWPGQTSAPTILATRAPWSSALLGQPLALITATAPRNERAPTSHLKALGYLDNILAAREAAERGADDALMLNTGGRIACTTIANLFVLTDGRLATPPLREGCLPGIIRALVLEMAPGLGLMVDEAPLRAADLRDADAVFATNSLRLIRRVASLDGIVLPERGNETLAALELELLARMEAECGAPLWFPSMAAARTT